VQTEIGAVEINPTQRIKAKESKMKKLLLLITSIMFTTSIVFPQSWKYELDDRDGLWYKENSKTPFSGTNFSYWDNGKIRNKIVYKKGLRYKFYMYNENGKKIYEDIIKNNIREETEWYENGKKKNHEFFLLQEEGGSMYTGKWTYWYENGKKKEERTYKDGEPDGKSTFWFENGQKWWELTYKDGERDGLYTVWYKNGQKRLEDTYKDGKYDGLETYWDENGQKRKESTWKDGNFISAKEWNEDGSVRE